MADRQALHGARDGDIEQAPLFIESAFNFGSRVWKEAVLETST
jgi:hypothetical protein